MTKYSVVFFIAGILVGMAFSPARRYFTSKWFWSGVAVALLIFLPNLIWLVRHDFISYKFLQHIHTRDVGEGRADGYLLYQFLVCANLFAAPVWTHRPVLILARSPLSHDRLHVSRSASSSSGSTRAASTTSRKPIPC